MAARPAAERRAGARPRGAAERERVGMGREVYLKGISYELEEPCGIEQLQELRDNRELLTTLRSLGVAAYSPSQRSPAELAAAAISRTLWKAKVAPEDVDLLLYTTSTFWNSAFYGKDVHALI